MENQKSWLEQLREANPNNPMQAAKDLVFEAFLSLPGYLWKPAHDPKDCKVKNRGQFKILNTELDIGNGMIVEFTDVVVNGEGMWLEARDGGTIKMKRGNRTLLIRQNDGIYFSFNDETIDYQSEEDSKTLTTKLIDIIVSIDKMKEEEERNSKVEVHRQKIAKMMKELADL